MTEELPNSHFAEKLLNNWKHVTNAEDCIPEEYGFSRCDPTKWPRDVLIALSDLAEAAPGPDYFKVAQNFLEFHVKTDQKFTRYGRHGRNLQSKDIKEAISDVNLLKKAISTIMYQWPRKKHLLRSLNTQFRFGSENILPWPFDAVLAMVELVRYFGHENNDLFKFMKRIVFNFKERTSDENTVKHVVCEDVLKAIQQVNQLTESVQLDIPKSFIHSCASSHVESTITATEGGFEGAAAQDISATGQGTGHFQTVESTELPAQEALEDALRNSTAFEFITVDAILRDLATTDLEKISKGERMLEDGRTINIDPEYIDEGLSFLGEIKAGHSSSGLERTKQETEEEDVDDSDTRRQSSFLYPDRPSASIRDAIRHLYNNAKDHKGAAFGDALSGPTIMTDVVAGEGENCLNECIGEFWSWNKHHWSYSALEDNREAIIRLESYFNKRFCEIIGIPDIKPDQAFRMTTDVLPIVLKIVLDYNIQSLDELHRLLRAQISKRQSGGNYHWLTVTILLGLWKDLRAQSGTSDVPGPNTPTTVNAAPQRSRVRQLRESSTDATAPSPTKMPRTDDDKAAYNREMEVGQLNPTRTPLSFEQYSNRRKSRSTSSGAVAVDSASQDQLQDTSAHTPASQRLGGPTASNDTPIGAAHQPCSSGAAQDGHRERSAAATDHVTSQDSLASAFPGVDNTPPRIPSISTGHDAGRYIAGPLPRTPQPPATEERQGSGITPSNDSSAATEYTDTGSLAQVSRTEICNSTDGSPDGTAASPTSRELDQDDVNVPSTPCLDTL